MKGNANNEHTEYISIPDLAAQYITALKTDATPFYMYGDAIVEPITDAQSGNGRLRPLTLQDLKWYLRRVFDQPESKIRAIAEDILHNPDLPLPRIRGLVATPAFREDLTLITMPGLDERSGLYFAPDPTLQDFEFRTNANKSEAKESLELVFELLTDFPFSRPTERFTYLAALLTLFLRSSIRSVVPGLAIDGNGQSVGKGLLSSMLSWILFGQDAASMSVPKDRTEWGSKIDSILLEGKSLQVIDNIVGHFASDDFASTLTATRRNVRIKGLSKVVDVPAHTFWVLNGNNMSVDSDMAQRLLMCHLQHEDANSRKQEKFHIQTKYGCSLEALLRTHRAKYMQACLDIICGWVNDGAPKRKKLVMAKYGEWESNIGGIFDWLRPDAKFLSDHQMDTLAVDTEKDEAITFLKQLMIAFPSCDREPISVSQIAEKVFSKESRSPLRDFVPDGLIASNSSFAKRLGRWLRNAATRRWGSIELVPTKDTHENVWTYRIGVGIKSAAVPQGLLLEDGSAAA